ncbi:MAG TPA: hypothetical protein VL400_05315 [Polyangiaceae bacterium]|nr:hypothetical protein [Polyangiaceae bacterium]
MSARSGPVTVTVALVLNALGFFGGAFGSAYWWREHRAEPWRKLVVEHEGVKGAPTLTRVVFKNPDLALQAIELTRARDGKPTAARVSLKDGTEIGARYRDDVRPTALEGSDGAKATLEYTSNGAKVTLFGPDGAELGAKSVHVPASLRSALELAQRERETGPLRLASLFEGEARADEAAAQDDTVTVRRDVDVTLGAKLTGGKVAPGPARLEASCAPLTCIVEPAEIPTPSDTTVHVTVTGTGSKKAIGASPSGDELAPFDAVAKSERKEAQRALPEIGTVVAAVGMTSLACRALGVETSVCVPGLGKTGTQAGAAIVSLGSYEVPTSGAVVDERAVALYYEDRARAALDAAVHVELCASRDGYARTCAAVDGRPFAETAMAPVQRELTLARRVGATLPGTFVVTQSDGSDCKFSPSPRTAGKMTISVDSERGTVTASMQADEHGTRPDLGCSLGTANMSWSQTYSVSATKTFTKDELTASGKLPIRLSGTMSGTGSYSFSNCRSGGASAACPGGKREPYTYPVDVVGDIDIEAGTGSGTIIVKNAPLSTSGTWTLKGGAP